LQVDNLLRALSRSSIKAKNLNAEATDTNKDHLSRSLRDALADIGPEFAKTGDFCQIQLS